MGELATFNPNADLPAQFEYVDLESVAGTEMLSHRTEIRDSAPSRAQRLAQFGDLFYQTVRPYQKNNYLYEKPDNNYVFSTGYAQMRPLVDGYFLLSLVQNEGFIKKVLDNCSGTSYPAINANVLSSIVVNSSSHRKEQIQVGYLFRRIDNLITLHQRKLDALKKIKSALLEKMFPKDGSDIPEIRFAGFTEAWEQRKLGDLSKILGGFAWSSKEYTPRGEFLVITISNVTGDYFIDDSIGNRINLEKESNYILASGDILVSLTGNVGRVSKMGSSKGVLNQRVAKMIPSKKIEIEFLFQLMRDTKFELKMIESGQGAAQKNISNNNILSYSTNIPNISEQKRIGHTFKKIDSLITLHQRKLDALKKIKSALLEKMFV